MINKTKELLKILLFMMVFTYSCGELGDALACNTKYDTFTTERAEYTAAIWGDPSYNSSTECSQLITAVNDYIDSSCGTYEDLDLNQAGVDTTYALGVCY